MDTPGSILGILRPLSQGVPYRDPAQGSDRAVQPPIRVPVTAAFLQVGAVAARLRAVPEALHHPVAQPTPVAAAVPSQAAEAVPGIPGEVLQAHHPAATAAAAAVAVKPARADGIRGFINNPG